MAGGIGTNALSQITISGLTTAGSSGYSALFDMNDEQRYGPHIKKYSIFEKQPNSRITKETVPTKGDLSRSILQGCDIWGHIEGSRCLGEWKSKHP